LFSVNEEEKKANPDMLYNVVASAYRPSENNTNNTNVQAQANPSYDNAPQQTHTTSNGQEIPVEDEEIPF